MVLIRCVSIGERGDSFLVSLQYISALHSFSRTFFTPSTSNSELPVQRAPWPLMRTAFLPLEALPISFASVL